MQQQVGPKGMLPLVSPQLLLLLAVQVPSERECDETVRQAMRRWAVPGCAVVLVREDRVVYLRGHGVRQVGESDAVTADTLFPLSSCSKGFTSAVLAQLVAEGKLNWDDPVRHHLPWFRLSDPLVEQAVTLRDLLCHRTGLGPHELLWHGAPWGPEEAVRRLRYLPLERPFRTSVQYQSTAFAAAGLAAERVTGRSWSQLVQERLLGPLQMTATKTSYPEAHKTGQLARGHLDGELVRWADSAQADPAISIYSSARDLGAWLRYQLREPLLAETHTPQMVTRLSPSQKKAFPNTHQISYALGWTVHDYRGLKLVSHGGSIDGFRCHLTLVPQKKLGIAVLCNQQFIPMPLALANTLLDRQLGFPARDWHTLLEQVERELAQARQPPRWHRGTSPSRELSAYVGDYDHPAYGTVSLSPQQGLLVWRWREETVPLQHGHYDTFTLVTPSLGAATLTFSFHPTGEVEAFTVTGKLGVSFRKVRRTPR